MFSLLFIIFLWYINLIAFYKNESKSKTTSYFNVNEIIALII